MKKKYTRKLSFYERLYIAGDKVCPPVLNQFFFDGSGVLDLPKWKEAVRAASEANPGSRLVLKGVLGGAYWEDSGQTPSVIELDGADWASHTPNGMPPHFKTTFDVKKGPTCEVVLLRGNPLRVVFRTHHSTMDGMGTLVWAEDVFRALRGEPLLGSESAVTDLEVARAMQKEYRTPFPFDNLTPTGKAQGNEKGVAYYRTSRKGKFHMLIGQAAVLSAREAWKHRDGKVRFSVPVDLRRHMKGIRSTGNLTMLIHFEVTKESTPESISQIIKKQLEENRECMIDRGDTLLSHVPFWIIQNRWKKMGPVYHNRGLYRNSGVISNMGRMPPMHLFSGGGFQAEYYWAIPPGYDHIPFFLGMASTGDRLVFTTSMPKVLASNGRIEKVTEDIMAGLVPAPPKKE
ncbi:MAG: hypothetical protein KJ737_12590 [Proteobacteria bacterium]|nr:hypothetical protein [Pseudomonadota bacterium]